MSTLRAVYLTGEHIYLRAMVKADAEAATAWFNSPFPVNAGRAEEFLKEGHGVNQWDGRKRYFAIARRSDDQIVGGAGEDVYRGVGYELELHMAPWLDEAEADALRAETLRLLVPWQLDERDAMVVSAQIPADQRLTIAAAEEVGMRQTARLRRHIARPGHRVDLLLYEVFNPRWEARHA